MRHLVGCALGVALLAACGGGGSSDGPLTFVVTSPADAGPGTLRELLGTVPAGGRITFEPGLANVLLSSAPLTVDRSVTIQGLGADDFAIEGGGSVALLEVAPGADLELSELALSNAGRGIQAFGTVRATRVLFSNLTAGFGGAFDIQGGGDMTLTECVVRECTAFNGGGGGVNQQGALLARRCTWMGNATTGNSGGALVLVDGTAVLVNCTMSQNTATGSGAGGAIGAFDEDTISDVTLIQCTLTENSAGGDGGGIAVGGSHLVCRGCILAANSAGGSGPDVHFGGAGNFVTLGFNVVGVDDGNPFVNGIQNDQVGALLLPLVPLLGPLADNGGPTPTHAVLALSPARDQIPTASCLDENGQPLDHDQRGEARPGGSSCDVGAFEL